MEPFIRLNHITKKYNESLALDDVSFSIHSGRCVGLIGVNGAGKTTTLRIISGLIQETNGSIAFEGKQIPQNTPAFKRRIGYLSQHPKFYNWMTGYDFLSYMFELYQLPKSQKNTRIEEVLEIVKLKGSERKRIRGYSGGMKQRLGIAQAILHKPDFLILDEPVSALDPEGRHQIIQLLQKLKKHTTILLSTHILHDADSVCDDVIILHEGKKIVETELLSLKKLHQEPIIKASFLKETKELPTILKDYDWIEQIETDHHDLQLRVSDKEKALMLLPSIFTENHYAFYSFQLFEPTLEDIFLKLVSNS